MFFCPFNRHSRLLLLKLPNPSITFHGPGNEFYKYGIVPCDVVDTMGAGDSYIAGFLYAVCQGKSIPEAMADGAKNSSVTIAYYGAW